MPSINQNHYKGNTPELYELFLRGEQLEYRTNEYQEWRTIPKYTGEPSDIYRVSNKHYIFSTTTTTL